MRGTCLRIVIHRAIPSSPTCLPRGVESIRESAVRPTFTGLSRNLKPSPLAEGRSLERNAILQDLTPTFAFSRGAFIGKECHIARLDPYVDPYVTPTCDPYVAPTHSLS
jgi:hypothetical protein